MIHKREFYFVRHGQTDLNASNNLSDGSDVPINARGIEQAKAIGPIIASLPIQTICCSPLRRAKETKEIIASKLSATHCEIAELGECCGDVWTEMTRLGSKALSIREGKVSAFMNRVRSGINLSLTQPGPVLIVAHGGVHWALCCFLGVDHEWVIDNCVPVHFTIEGDQWKAKKLAR